MDTAKEKGFRQSEFSDDLSEIKLTNEEMLNLIKKLMAGQGSDEEAGDWLYMLERNANGAPVGDYIFWPEKEEENLTAEQILDKALAYEPRILVTSPPQGDKSNL
jgi:hypothetical protein